MLNGLSNALARLHRSEQGATKLEYLLIVAAITLPLLGVLLIFRRQITGWISAAWESVLGQANNQTTPNPGLPTNP